MKRRFPVGGAGAKKPPPDLLRPALAPAGRRLARGGLAHLCEGVRAGIAVAADGVALADGTRECVAARAVFVALEADGELVLG